MWKNLTKTSKWSYIWLVGYVCYFVFYVDIADSCCCLESCDVYIWCAAIKGAHVPSRVIALRSATESNNYSHKTLISSQSVLQCNVNVPPDCPGTFNNCPPNTPSIWKGTLREKMSGNWTDGAWMYFTDWLRHQLSASFSTCITAQGLEASELDSQCYHEESALVFL